MITAFLLMSASLSAQLDDTVRIQEVVVSDLRTKGIIANEREIYDSSEAHYGWSGTLTDAVSRATGIYVRTYSPGGLSSISYRGASASQVAVRYQDVPINSMMNGQADLNIIPLALSEKVSIITGGMMEYGNGGLGAELHIENTPHWKKGLNTNFAFEGGSFSTYTALAGLTVGTKKFQSNTKILYNRASNDFSFKNTALFGSPEQQLQHASSAIGGGAQEFYWRPNKAHLIEANGLFTISDRDIPPTMVSIDRGESQFDRLSIGSLRWTFTRKQHKLKSSINYKREFIRYIYEQNAIDDTSRADNWLAFINYIRTINSKWKVEAKYESNNQRAFTENYDGSHFRTVNSLMIKATYTPVRQATFTAAIRQDLNDKQFMPFLPLFKVRWTPVKEKALYLEGSTSLNYRLPTFNDLYWVPGGNADLESEKSWNIEGSVSGTKKWLQEKIQLSGKLSGYRIYINNKILWQPYSTTIWSPVNIATVLSKGLEALTDLQVKKGRWQVGFSANYHFTSAIDISGGPTDGNQLIYVPYHLGNLSLQLKVLNYSLRYHHHFTGTRYSNADNTQEVAGFTVGDLLLGSDFTFNHHSITLYFKIENLWNKAYQNFAWRPMPGRAFFGGFKYDFNNRKT